MKTIKNSKKAARQKVAFEKFAKIAHLEKQYKEDRKYLSEQLLKKYGETVVQTSYGIVEVRKKEKLKITSKAGLIKNITQLTFNKLATFSKRKIVKVIGQQGLDSLIKRGVVKLSPLSTIYTLKS